MRSILFISLAALLLVSSPVADAAHPQHPSVSAWAKKAVAHIKRHMRAPPCHLASHAKAIVSFHMAPTGHVLRATIYKSTGRRDMDVESLAAVARASPLPPLPPLARVSDQQVLLPIAFVPCPRRPPVSRVSQH